jgi:uridine monophosphate synthetase
VARQAQTWGDAAQVAFVVGATQPDALRRVRALAPDRWLLAPGIGAQGGDLRSALSAGLDARNSGVIVPVSRAVLRAADPRTAASGLREQIHSVRSFRDAHAAPAHRALASALHDAGCIRFGQFTLASGAQSPVYVDLRRSMSHPEAFRAVVAAYADVIRSLDAGPDQPDLLAGVPYASLPMTGAVALALGRPMVYPRKEPKAHGTGQMVEGQFAVGQSVLLLEDVITSGGSILTAVETLRAAGLRVPAAVVLVDREQGGAAALARSQVRLHTVMSLSDLVATLQDDGRISSETAASVAAYLAGG